MTRMDAAAMRAADETVSAGLTDRDRKVLEF